MRKIILKISILFIVLFLGTGVVEAASFSVSVGSKSLSKGSTTKLTIKGTDVTGRFNIKSSNSSVVSISEDRAWIENNTYTIKLSALSVGTSTITITPSGVSDSNGNPASLSAKTIKITVSLPREKSTDNTLKSLSVDGYEISPSFDKNTLDYSVSVPEGTKNIKVSASATSTYAKVTGSGEIDVTEGINNLSIVVKAENGSERIYNLVVNVIDQNPIYVGDYTIIKLRDNYTCPELFEESEVVINNTPIPSCTNEFVEYNLIGLKSDDGKVLNYIYDNGEYKEYRELSSSNLKIIPEDFKDKLDYEESNLSISDNEYKVYKLDNNRFYLIYGMNIQNGEKDYYIYDKKNNTFSTYNLDLIESLNEQNKVYLYVISAFGIGLFLSIICIIILNGKIRKIRKKFKNSNNDLNIDKKKDKRKKKNKNNDEEIKESDEKVIEEDINEVKEINNDEENLTETYYLFESDKKKKKRK